MSETASLLMRIQIDQTQPVKLGFDTDGLETWRQTLSKLEDGVKEVGVEEEQILKDRDLTPEGQRRKLDALASRVVGNFAWLGKLLEQADASRDRLSVLLFAPITKRPVGDPTVMFLREQEIRAAFRGADAGMRTGEYLRAAEAGDIETTRAFQDAPGAPWVSAEIKARAEEAYALRTNPDGLRRLKGIEFLREHLSSLAEQTAQWLVRLGAKPETVAKAVKEAA